MMGLAIDFAYLALLLAAAAFIAGLAVAIWKDVIQ